MPKALKPTDTVLVAVRCRPLNSRETEDARERIVLMSSGTSVAVAQPGGSGMRAVEEAKTFTFDRVYDWNSTQESLFEECGKPIVDAVMEGYNGTIFAYGQTGTGKTFTMVGPDGGTKFTDPSMVHLRGITPRTFAYIFDTVAGNASPDTEFLVRASMLEIYNEEIRDLLSKNPKNKLDLKQDPDKGVFVDNLSAFVLESAEEIETVFTVGNKNRSTGATLMNQDSSRSHCIFSIIVERSEMGADGEQHIRMGKLHLVDLAGSERQGKTGATGDRLKEATKINLSLSALGNVINQLVEGKSQHVSYRDSKLTRLLQDSLGGNAKTVMVANLGPADYNYDETLSTLRYANRAKSIKNKPKINEDPKDAMLREFQDKIASLKKQLAEQGPAGGGGVKTVEVVKEVGYSDAEVTREKERFRQQLQQEREQTKKQKAEMVDQVNTGLQAYEAEKHARVLLERQMQALESKIQKSGGDEAAIKQRIAEEQRAAANIAAEVESRREAETQLQRQLDQQEEQNMETEAKFAGVSEEAAAKSRKLEKIRVKYDKVKDEKENLQDEFAREREEMMDAIRGLQKQLSLADTIIAHFIPVRLLPLTDLPATVDPC